MQTIFAHTKKRDRQQAFDEPPFCGCQVKKYFCYNCLFCLEALEEGHACSKWGLETPYIWGTDLGGVNEEPIKGILLVSCKRKFAWYRVQWQRLPRNMSCPICPIYFRFDLTWREFQQLRNPEATSSPLSTRAVQAWRREKLQLSLYGIKEVALFYLNPKEHAPEWLKGLSQRIIRLCRLNIIAATVRQYLNPDKIAGQAWRFTVRILCPSLARAISLVSGTQCSTH